MEYWGMHANTACRHAHEIVSPTKDLIAKERWFVPPPAAGNAGVAIEL